ncbi:Homeobox-leucine zipper protein ATHB-54 [Theobroma cacao]|uniref:Homeobox-leucine zipper protein ATHB-54 n=1 Tax=Theobroma cacao TaxID=3641 RepID=A0A061E795_THECC|nr:Homeobox-leucine zipper protein ATHB-54 [Theobroma cacao]
MSRKRDKPYFSRLGPASISKRRRPLPPYPLPPPEDEDKPTPPPAVVVMGLPPNCSVLDLKSRFEIYGPISRIRINRDAVGYIAYRSKESAESAIAASLDSSFGITIDSTKVQVLWATDPLAKWREGVGVGANKDNGSSSSSKLLRPEVPLSRHGRGNKLASAIVNPRSSDDGSSMLEVPFKGRGIVAYDDIL